MYIKEIVRPIKEYYQINRRKTNILQVGLPILLAIIYPILCGFIDAIRLYSIFDFYSEMLNQMITVMALFITFTMAYLTILITSSSDNVEHIKKSGSNKFLNEKEVSLFQELLCCVTYALTIEIIYLTIVFAQKFLIYIVPNNCLNIGIAINIAIFIHLLGIVLIIIKNTYFAFWNPEDDTE